MKWIKKHDFRLLVALIYIMIFTFVVLLYIPTKWVYSLTVNERFFLRVLGSAIWHLYILLIVATIMLTLTSQKDIKRLFTSYKKVKLTDFNKPYTKEYLVALKILMNYYYIKSPTFLKQSFTLISASIAGLYIFFLAFFYSAFIWEMLFLENHLNEELAYISTLITWITLFTILFRFYNARFYNIRQRKIYIFIFLLLMLFIALIYSKFNMGYFLSFYAPYTDLDKNTQIQSFLHQRIVKYSNYLIEWSIIQGIISLVLEHFNIGATRQKKYEQKIQNKKIEYSAVMSIIDLLNELFQNIQMTRICLTLDENYSKANPPEQTYNVRNTTHQQFEVLVNIKPLSDRIRSNYILIQDEAVIGLLNIWPFLLDSHYIDGLISLYSKDRLKVCNRCKMFYYGSAGSKCCNKCLETADDITK